MSTMTPNETRKGLGLPERITENERLLVDVKQHKAKAVGMILGRQLSRAFDAAVITLTVVGVLRLLGVL